MGIKALKQHWIFFHNLHNFTADVQVSNTMGNSSSLSKNYIFTQFDLTVAALLNYIIPLVDVHHTILNRMITRCFVIQVTLFMALSSIREWLYHDIAHLTKSVKRFKLLFDGVQSCANTYLHARSCISSSLPLFCADKARARPSGFR